MNRTNSYSKILAVVMGAGAVTALAGCSTATTPVRSAPVASGQLITLAVENHNWRDIRVYMQLSEGAIPVRVGNVTSFTTAVFTLHDRFSDGIARLLIRPMASREIIPMYPILVQAGEQIRIRFENEPSLSSVVVR